MKDRTSNVLLLFILVFIFHIPILAYLIDSEAPFTFILMLLWVNIPAIIFYYLTLGNALDMGNLGAENIGITGLIVIEGFYLSLIYLLMKFCIKSRNLYKNS